MNIVIGFIAVAGLAVLAAGGVVAYRWSRDRERVTAAGKRLEWSDSRTEPDTQAGRI